MFPQDITTLARGLLKEAQAANLHIALAESCTGGLVAAALTEIEGASAVVERGFVVYTNRAKIELLGVSQVLLRQHGAVSEEVARAMVEGALKHSPAEMAVSVTGIAGPAGGTPAKPVGLVHLAAARARGTMLHEERRFGDIGRAEVRMRSVEAALKLLFQLI
jgi:nicotinamide-nucleotide amidase